MSTTAEEAAKEVSEKIDALKSQIEKGATKEEVEAALKEVKDSQLEAIKDLVSKDELTKLQDIIKEQGEDIVEFKNNSKAIDNTDNLITSLEKSLKEKSQEVNDVLKGRLKETVIKATVTRASVADSTQSIRLSGIGQLGTKVRSLYNVFPKVPVAVGDHNGKAVYIDWDEDTIVRAAAAVAEGASFPESTAGFKQYEEKLIKIGDSLPVTEEFGEDQVTAARELDRFLRTNVNTKVDNDLMLGAGGSTQLNGFLNQIPAFTAEARGIQAPNVYDLAVEVSTKITTDRGSKYSPDFVVMNDNTLNVLKRTKDANNNYIFRDITAIDGMTIVVDNYLGNNQIAVGDSSFGEIYEMQGVEISEGMVGNDYLDDMKRIKARVRMMLLIRNVDRTGFFKVADVQAALATLGNDPA